MAGDTSSEGKPNVAFNNIRVDPCSEVSPDGSRKQMFSVKDHKMSSEDAQQLLKKHGYNEVASKSASEWSIFLKRYIGLMPIIMEITASLAVSVPDENGNRDWISFSLLIFTVNLMVLASHNSDRNAKNALRTLRALSKPTCICRRNNTWIEIKARELVPGDLVQLRAGVVIPADGIIVGEGVPLLVDESSLTGETGARIRQTGEEVMSGAVVERGELEMLVTKTGENSFYGKALALLGQAQPPGHLKTILMKAAKIITATGFFFCCGIFFTLVFRDDINPLLALKFSFVVLSSIIPAAMPVVTATVLAVGAKTISQESAIVQRLSAIEEMAGMEILCSDKTGTLTKNQLVLEKAECAAEAGYTVNTVLLYASLASNVEHAEPIDVSINSGVDMAERAKYTIRDVIPFDPVNKRSASTVTSPDGKTFRVVKGAPNIIRDMVLNGNDEDRDRINLLINSRAERGLRTLGVCVDKSAVLPSDLSRGRYELIGFVALFDPPRDDTKFTIKTANELGVEVKMITGDQTAIAIETAKRLGMGVNIAGPEVWLIPLDSTPFLSKKNFGEYCASINGFAGVFPEHKYKVVEALMVKGDLIGMTGDGVNDAPALKLATVGIAVAGATEAAKAAADIVLLKPGLSTIITAIMLSRQIFKRIEAYIIYRIASSTYILLFFFTSVVCLQFSVPSWMILLIALVNYFTILSCAKDNVPTSDLPLHWDMMRTCALGFFVGVISVANTLVLVYFVSFNYYNWWDEWSLEFAYSNSKEDLGRIVACLYLNISLTVTLNFLVCRSASLWFCFDNVTCRIPAKIVVKTLGFSLVLCTILAIYWPVNVAIGGGPPMSGLFGFRGDTSGWRQGVIIWVWSLIWIIACDVLKSGFRRLYEGDVSEEILYGEDLGKDPDAKNKEKRLSQMRNDLIKTELDKKGGLHKRVTEQENMMRRLSNCSAGSQSSLLNPLGNSGTHTVAPSEGRILDQLHQIEAKIRNLDGTISEMRQKLQSQESRSKAL